MAGIGRGDREAQLKRTGPLGGAAQIVGTVARVPAVADHVEAAVPACGQIDFKADLRRQRSTHAAMRRRVAGRGNLARLDLRDLLVLELREVGAGLARLDFRL